MIDFNQAGPQRPEKYQIPETPDDPVLAFRMKMQEFGLEPPGAIVTDGSLQRFRIGNRRDLSGWYVFHYGDICGASFGNWATDLKETWCSKDTRSLTDKEAAEYQEKIRKGTRLRKEQESRNHEAARKNAQDRLSKSKPASPDHAYFQRKNVKPYDGIHQEKNTLLVPLRDSEGQIWSVQEIYPDGKKKFPFGTKKKGNSFTIAGSDTLMICEGYATGASIHEATDATVIIAFDRGNMKRVALRVRKKYPGAHLIICGDNDLHNPGNPGFNDAKEAARAANAEFRYPVFQKYEGKDTSDFNDLARCEGPEAVKAQIQVPGEKAPFPPLTADLSRVKGRLISQPEPIEYIYYFNDQGLIPKGVVGVICAAGGVGKTFWLLSLAMAAASGGNFGPINSRRPLNTLILVAEDPQDELDRRLWNIGKGNFPDNLHAASIYGEVGPLMRIDGNVPVRADGFYWLERTIQNHHGLELLIIDPKSRLYGLNENDNDHSTQWIQSLEYLAKKYNLTILFSHHTSKDESGKISQTMGRGGSAIVDGCRWQAGLIRMDQKTADNFGIEDERNHIIFDMPKSNYSPHLPGKIYFKRTNTGVLEFCNPYQDRLKNLGEALIELLKADTVKYTKKDLIKEEKGKDIFHEMKEAFPNFKRNQDMKSTIKYLINEQKIYESFDEKEGRGRDRKVIYINE